MDEEPTYDAIETYTENVYEEVHRQTSEVADSLGSDSSTSSKCGAKSDEDDGVFAEEGKTKPGMNMEFRNGSQNDFRFLY